MAKASLVLLKLLIIVVFSGWVSLWLLKPTKLWTNRWHLAEESASETVFGYNGLHFVVYTLPVIALAILGNVYLELKRSESRSRQGRSSVAFLSSPIFVNQYVGILCLFEILAVFLFILFLAWTFYSRISDDFHKMTSIKSFKLEIWQYKMFRMVTRCGLLAEACLALLLLPILRGLAVFRLLGIQFEASVRYHTWLGTAMIFFATLHGVGTLFIWGIRHRIIDEAWKWQNEGRIYLAGEITLISGLVIWITSLPQIRRKKFEFFYYTHHLYIIFLVFFLFHTGDRHFYTVFPGIFLFVLDKLFRIIQSRPSTCVLSARLFPCKAVELVLPKDPRLKYALGSVVLVKIPMISKFEWHSFSITSSCSLNDESMSVIIKGEGWWTNSLHNIIEAELKSGADQRKYIPIAIEGPYGPPTTDFLRYDNLLLVAGGIGITPFLSILQEIASIQFSRRNRLFPSRIQLIYAVKKSQDISLLTPIMHILLDLKALQFQFKVKLFVTQEQQPNLTMNELLSEQCRTQAINFDLKDPIFTTYGVENLTCLAAIVGVSSIAFLFCLISLNRVFLFPAKMPSKHKFPSSISDLFLLFSFLASIICCAFMATSLRWINMRKRILELQEKQETPVLEMDIMDVSLEQHEIHFGRRPNLPDIFSKFLDETSRSDVGVLVCGPESMKGSVASLCQLNSQGLRNSTTQTRKSHLSFHSLNFIL